ncbi:MAG: hypothetical protein E6J41_20250 [Chloroflexi bacterium]|nr:MAG: hypothetical protein E6J41_20250 [Chloroflexota bacterium]
MPEKHQSMKRYPPELKERAVRMVQETIEQNNAEQFVEEMVVADKDKVLMEDTVNLRLLEPGPQRLLTDPELARHPTDHRDVDVSTYTRRSPGDPDPLGEPRHS